MFGGISERKTAKQMRRFSPEFIEQVRLANNIVDIIGEDTFLKPSGTGERYTGLCPFPSHNEKTPSFSVSTDKQLYHCFGCNESGNIFTYLKIRKGLSFGLAVEELARRAGIALPEPEPSNFEGRNAFAQARATHSIHLKIQKLLTINQLACEFYENQLKALPSHHKAKKCLEQRGFSAETIQQFRLGYAPKSWDALLNFLQKKGADISLAVQVGIIRKKDARHYDLFRDRLMFPIFAKNGTEVLGFGGRIIEEKEKQPKYINSVDSDIFHKGKTFYGWQEASPFIRSDGKVLVVEGYTDYLSLYQKGVKNVVATLGTALTADHVRWLSWHTKQVLVFFDGDEAGEKASLRSLSVLLSFGLVPRLLKLDEDLDPDSFVCKFGVEDLHKKIKSAPDLFTYVFSNELKKHSAGADRFSVIEKAARILAHTKNETLKKYYSELVVDSFGADEKIAREALKKALTKAHRAGSDSSFTEPFNPSFTGVTTIPKLHNVSGGKKSSLSEQETLNSNDLEDEEISLLYCSKVELYLLLLAIQDKEYYQQISESRILNKLNHPGVIRLFEIIKKLQKENQMFYFNTLPETLSGYLADPGVLQIKHHPILACLSAEKTKVFIQDCINKVEKERKYLQIKQVTADMRLDMENPKKYLMKIRELTKRNKMEMKHDK